MLVQAILCNQFTLCALLLAETSCIPTQCFLNRNSLDSLHNITIPIGKARAWTRPTIKCVNVTMKYPSYSKYILAQMQIMQSKIAYVSIHTSNENFAKNRCD